MTVRPVLVVAALVSFASCSDGNDSSPSATTASTAAITTVPHTGPSDDLAPSQITASTVPPPATPPPCDPDALSLWTAQVRFVDNTAEAVIRVRNDDADRCEVAVFDSRQDDSPCYQCLYRMGDDDQTNCATNGVMAPVVGIIGAVQAMEAIKLIAGVGDALTGRLLLLDARRLTWRELRLPRDPHCPACGGNRADA